VGGRGVCGWCCLLFENCTVDASIFVSLMYSPFHGSSCLLLGVGRVVGGGLFGVQVFKGTRWMPWHQEPMKDVGACDMPRGVGNQTLIRGFPNGETWHPSWGVAAV
jgi:hypothetical protein